MLTTLDRALEDTTLPGANARRVWSAPDVVSHGMIVITLPRLYLLPKPVEHPDELRQRILAGADLSELLPEAEAIFLVEIERAILHLEGLRLELHTFTGVREVRFANAETADDLFTKLLHRTRGQFQLTSNLPPLTNRLRMPLGVLAAILLTTVIMAITVDAARDLAPPPGDPEQSDWRADWLRILSRVDWRNICLIGGIASAWVQWEVHRRWRQLPTIVSLIPKDPEYAP
jgi:hypothetical protein